MAQLFAQRRRSDEPALIKAIDYLASILIVGRDHNWEIGPLGHGLHSLRIYDRRVFKPLDAPEAVAAWRDADNAEGEEAARSTDNGKTSVRQF